MTLANAAGEVPIRTLRPGDGFNLYLDICGKVRPGCVVYLTSGSATVQLLEKIERTIRLSDGKEIPIQSVVGMQHWCLDTMVIPDGSRHDISKYESQIQIEGASHMAKEKAAKKSKAVKEPKAPKVREYVVTKYTPTAKADSEKGKELAGKNSHNGTILKTLMKSKEPMTLAEIMIELSPKEFGTESKNPETIYRWHISDLAKKGFIKSIDDKVEATSAVEARGGEAAAA